VAGEVDQRLQRAATGLEKDGFDVPMGFMDRLLFEGQAASPVLEKCSVFPVSTGQVTFPRVTESTRVDSQFGGVQTYWIEEAGEIEKSKPQIGTANLSMKKLVSLAIRRMSFSRIRPCVKVHLPCYEGQLCAEDRGGRHPRRRKRRVAWHHQCRRNGDGGKERRAGRR
jgi:hypothetical protein